MMTTARFDVLRMVWSLLLGATVLQAQAAKRDEQQAFLTQVNRPVVYQIPGMDSVKVRANIAYEKDAHADSLLMDLYTPPNARGPLPVVIFIHGGVEPDAPLRPKDWGF